MSSESSYTSQVSNGNDDVISVSGGNTERRRTDRITEQTPMQKLSIACIEMISNNNQLISNRSYRRKYWTTQKS